MKLFELHQKEAWLIHKNDRTETHGDESVPAFDADFEIQVGNDFLDLLYPGLKGMFFSRPDAPDLADTADYMPLLKCPILGAQPVDLEWVNCRLVIHRERLTEDDDIVIGDAKIKKVSFLAIQSGSVKVKFRASFQADELDDEEIGYLTRVLNAKGLKISLTRPLDDEVEETILDNKPVQNPIQAANDDEDEDDEIDARPAFVERGRGRSRGR